MNYTTTEPATLSPAPSASVLDEHAKGWRKKLGQTIWTKTNLTKQVLSKKFRTDAKISDEWTKNRMKESRTNKF